MRKIFILVLSLIGGGIISWLSSFLFNFIAKQKASQNEKLCIESLSTLDEIIAEIKKRGVADSKKKELLLSDGMNYVMTAHSKNQAENYIKKISEILGEEGVVWHRESELILEERFH